MVAERESADDILTRVTSTIIRDRGLAALWMQNWSAQSCRPAFAFVCPDCQQAYVRIGASRLHPGDPRIALVQEVLDGHSTN